MKVVKFILTAIVLLAAVYFMLTPVNWNEKEQAYEIQYEQLIDLSVEEVFDYLGQSDQATNWSSFVSKIEVLNPELEDGSVGIKRVCFAKKYPTNATWEEEILKSEKNKLRRLSIYNLKNFPMVAKGLFTDQLFRKENKNQSRLTLALYLPAGDFWNTFKFYLVSPYVSDIFSDNLNNIKTILENGA